MLAQNFKTAADLGISDEELDAHKKVLGMLERGELQHIDLNHNSVIKPASMFDFNMAIDAKQTTCGTVACIGGWVGLLMGLDSMAAGEYVAAATDAQELLYYPDAIRQRGITTDQAARALRNWLTTGEPSWDEVLT